MGKLTTSRAVRSPLAAILLGLALGTPAPAQSATNFDPQIASPESPTPVKPQRKAGAEAGPVSTTPSRNIGAADLDAYLESMASVFLIKGRTRDSFGQMQDPDAKPIIKVSTPVASQRKAAVQATPFADIVGYIVVTTIMPGEKRFLVGTRSFKQGGTIPITFRHKPLRVQITEVTSRQIGFRNLDTGETAFRKLDMLPVGMTPGSRGITAPGMVADSPNSPIELGTGDPLP